MKNDSTALPNTPEAPFRCAWCDEPAFRRSGRQMLCKKHIRFQQMRVNSKRHGKDTPSYLQLENLLSHLNSFQCPTCNRPMNWMANEGHSTVITLQHDRSHKPTRFRLLCLGCNVRHSVNPGDSFYDLPPKHKRCPMCGEVKPLGAFYKDSSRACGAKSKCKTCSDSLSAGWRSKNKARYNEYQRQWRADAMLAERAKQ